MRVRKNPMTPLAAVVAGLLAGAAGTVCLDAVHYLKYRRAGGTDRPLAWEFAPVESWETAPDPGQSQGAPGLLRLGVSVGTYRAPDVDMGRYWRVGVRVALQVDVIPPQRTRLFGPDAYQETQDDVAHAAAPRLPAIAGRVPAR